MSSKDRCTNRTTHRSHWWSDYADYKVGVNRFCPGVTLRHTEPCGCGIPNRSAYWYFVYLVEDARPWMRSEVRIYRCVKHRVSPRDLNAVRSMFEFDHPERFTIERVRCEPAPQRYSTEPRYAWVGWEGEVDLGNDDDRAGVHYLTITEDGEEMATIVHRVSPEHPTLTSSDPVVNRKERAADRIVNALNESEIAEDVEGCSCGMADKGAPGHDEHTEALAEEVGVDLRLRSQSPEEDTILRHYRGSRHNSAECPACKSVAYERRIGDRRVAECQTEIADIRAGLADAKARLDSIIEG